MEIRIRKVRNGYIISTSARTQIIEKDIDKALDIVKRHFTTNKTSIFRSKRDEFDDYEQIDDGQR